MPRFDPWAKAVERAKAESEALKNDPEWQAHIAEKRASELRSDIAAGIRDADGNIVFPDEDDPEDDEDAEGEDEDTDSA